MKKITLILLVFASLSLVACKGNKDNASTASKDETEAKKTAEDCDVLVTVMDYTGLDGCKYMLKLKDGSFLNPDTGVTRDQLVSCQQATISYTTKSGMSNCMKGKIADITCFSVVKEGTPVKPKNEF